MYRVVIVLIVFAFGMSGVKAQPAWLRTDSLTYRLYQDQEWKTLLQETRRSLNDGVDFYYLRVRAGRAAYALKNYRLAAHHFGKAYENNQSDEFVNYWYYYALLLGSRPDEASSLAQGFTSDYIHRMQIRPSVPVKSVLAESSVSINSSYTSLLGETIVGDYSFMAYRNVLSQQFYKSLGIDHRVSDRLYAFHGLSHLGIQRMQMFQSPLTRLYDQYESTASQFQYYLQGRYILKDGWSISPAITLITGHSLTHFITYRGPVPVLNQFRYNISDHALNAAIAKEFVRFRPKLSVSWGNINDYRQLQASGQVVLYPFGNPNIYSISDIIFHSDEMAEEPKVIYSQKVGIKTGPLWLSGEGIWGEIQNLSTSDGYVVFNMPETVRSIYGLSVYLPLFAYRLDATARVQILSKEGLTFDYSNTINFETEPYTFVENNFLISLRWHF